MDTLDKFKKVSEYLRYEPAEETGSTPGLQRSALQPGLASRRKGVDMPSSCPAAVGISGEPGRKSRRDGSRLADVPVFHAVMPGGRRIALLKTLLTTVCEKNCAYCAFRSGRDTERTTFTPDEMARGFLMLHQARQVEGLFLSSGVAGGGLHTQDRLLAAAEILRGNLGFRGYLHLKIMPGAQKAQVERAMQLADRVSINLEGPNPIRLAYLAPQKSFLDELLKPLEWVEEIRRSQPPVHGWKGRWPSTSTQFVVGGAGENDLELLGITTHLYGKLHLSRAYFSAFNPIPGTPLENQPPLNPWRQHRLYQASFLLRDYGFDLEEMPFTPRGDLPLEIDPKLAWARSSLAGARLELNRASREELLRIPGIGPKGAAAILQTRRQVRVTSPIQLRSMGINVTRAGEFILLDGKVLPVQPGLF